MSHKENDKIVDSILDAAEECPSCKEIMLTLEPSTADKYITEWYCGCGYFECRKNMEYDCHQLSDEELHRLDNEKQDWWQSLDADEEWIEREVGDASTNTR